MKLSPLLASVALAPLFSHAALPQDRDTPLPDFSGGYLTFYFDNDLFGGSDQDYTNGGRLTWVSPNKDAKDLNSFQRLLGKFSGDSDSFALFQKVTGFRDPRDVQYNYGFSLTQLMFTPEDPEPYTQPEGQRRYAGWAGLGFSLHAKDDRVLNTVELIFGTTGPHSYAENTQDFIHDLRDIKKFNGWEESQIPNEFTADLSFVQKRRLDFIKYNFGSFRMDAIGEWGARLGTFRTNAQIGGMYRFGWNLPPDFSDPRLSDTAYAHRYFDTDDPYVSPYSVYFLCGATGRAVAYDATLDGPMFRDFDTGNERVPLVGEVFAGFGVRFNDYEFSYCHTWRTEEYREQRDTIQDFGSIAIRVRF